MDKQSYLIILENNLVSDDDIIRNFMLDILNRSFVGDESTFMMGIEANRKNRVITQNNEHLKFLKNIPIPAEGVRRLLSDLGDDHVDQASHYMSLLNHVNPCLVQQFQGEISRTLKEKGIKVADLTFYTDLCSDPRDIIFQKFQGVIRKMNAAESFNYNHFILGKQMIQLIAKREFMGENEILYKLHNMKKREKLTLGDLYDIVLAGDMKIQAAIPKLLVLLNSHSEDEIFSDELVNTLVKIGTNEVVDFVKPLVQEGKKGRYHAIDVMSNIKTDYAKEALLECFKQEFGSFEKTMIAAGLCEQFSAKAIPLIEDFIDGGYEAGILPLEEHLYCNCVVNGINHPKLAEWRQVGHEESSEVEVEEQEKQEEVEVEKVEEQEKQEEIEVEKIEEQEIQLKPLEEFNAIQLEDKESEIIQEMEQEQPEDQYLEAAASLEFEEKSIIQKEESMEQDKEKELEQQPEVYKEFENEDSLMLTEGKTNEMVQEETEQMLSSEDDLASQTNTASVPATSDSDQKKKIDTNDIKPPIEQKVETKELEKRPSSQKQSKSIQKEQQVSNEELRAAMQRLINAREQSQAKKKLVKVGRNNPCPCGSGKKYKKCCM